VHKAVIFIGRIRINALAMETCEQRGRASSVKTLVVIEDANPQNFLSRDVKTEQPELLSIKVSARCVKAGRVLNVSMQPVSDSEREKSIADRATERIASMMKNNLFAINE
jgi:hypothetical protein